MAVKKTIVFLTDSSRQCGPSGTKAGWQQKTVVLVVNNVGQPKSSEAVDGGPEPARKAGPCAEHGGPLHLRANHASFTVDRHRPSQRPRLEPSAIPCTRCVRDLSTRECGCPAARLSVRLGIRQRTETAPLQFARVIICKLRTL